MTTQKIKSILKKDSTHLFAEKRVFRFVVILCVDRFYGIYRFCLVQCLCRGLCTTRMFTSATIIRCWAFWAQGFGSPCDVCAICSFYGLEHASGWIDYRLLIFEFTLLNHWSWKLS